MPFQLINVGTAPNSTDGDPLRVALQKVNDNFRALANVGPINGAAEIITAGMGNSDANIAMTWSASNNTTVISSTSISNGNIRISPRGTGRLILPSNSAVSIQGGLSGQFLATRGNGQLYWAYGGSNILQAAGGNYQVQYNINTQLTADANFTYNPTSGVLTLAGDVVANNITANADITADAVYTTDINATGTASLAAVTAVGLDVAAGITAVTGNFSGIVAVDSIQTDQYCWANGAPIDFQTVPAATAAGSNTQIQYNDAGTFGAAATLTFDASSNTLSVPMISATTVTATNGINGTLIGTVYGAIYASTIVSNGNITGTQAAFSGTVTANNFISTGSSGGGGNLNITAAGNLNLASTGEITAAAPLRLAGYTSGDVPMAAAGAVIYITSTNQPAYYDGTIWRYFNGSAV